MCLQFDAVFRPRVAVAVDADVEAAGVVTSLCLCCGELRRAVGELLLEAGEFELSRAEEELLPLCCTARLLLLPQDEMLVVVVVAAAAASP